MAASSSSQEQQPKGLLDQCRIGVIGVTDRDEKKRLIRIIHELGGIYCSEVKADTHCVLMKKVGPQHKAIQANKIPAVALEWLLDCRRNQRKHSFERYLVKPLIGLVICCTGYTNDERNLIEKCTTENGGIFSSKMNRESCTHLITEEEDPSNTSKYAYAKVWRTVQIVTMKWLTDCKKQITWINEYEYLVSTVAADEAQKVAEASKKKKETAAAKIESDKEYSRTMLDATKKRKSAQISQVLTLADFPSFELLEHRRCRGLFGAETFFISGFSLEIRDYIIKLILFGGGKRHHMLGAGVTKIILGCHADERLVSASRQHPLGAQNVTISWLIKTIFSA